MQSEQVSLAAMFQINTVSFPLLVDYVSDECVLDAPTASPTKVPRSTYGLLPRFSTDGLIRLDPKATLI